MEINQNAPVKQAKQIFIQASPQQVWAVLTDVNQWIKWNPKITQAQIQETPQSGIPFVWIINGTKIRSQLHTVAPYQLFGWSGQTF
ncbi:MAG: polyketide cyclase/dehydrase, partial [Bacteroidia bacterium]|nr:polyketide cyclase/dehydrase [Bacteroidia bacterium]